MKALYPCLFSAVLAGSFSVAQPAMAGQESGYAVDSDGQPVLSGSGECMHTGSWEASMPACPEPTVVFEEDQARILFTLDDSEFFGFDQVSLSQQAKADLDGMVNALKSADRIHGITITGHADRIGPSPYNERLALKRSEAVKRYLVSRGIPADRVQTLSDGSAQPLVTCPDIKNGSQLVLCLAPNRRVDIEALLATNVDIDRVIELPRGQQ